MFRYSQPKCAPRNTLSPRRQVRASTLLFRDYQRARETGALALVILVLQGCATSIGQWDQREYAANDFGSRRTINVCIYRDVGVPIERERELVRDSIQEWKQYGVSLNIIDRGEMERRGFWHHQLLNQIDSVRLTPPCDRVFWLVNRNAGDYLYADGPAFLSLGTLVAMPEVLGEVDDPTMTHGWAIAYGDSLNSLLMPPSAVLKHEFYHLVGSCPHAVTMDVCYQRISDLKHSQGRAGWYPSIGINGQEFLDPHEADRKLASYNDSLLP